MDGFQILIFLLILTPVLLLIWIVRLGILFKKGKSKRKSFWIQTGVLIFLLILITWNLGIFPLSKNFQIKAQTESLTGKSFWSWEEYSFEELGIRGEGYSIDIFKYNDKIASYFKNPDKELFEKYPLESQYRTNWERVTWKPTPVLENEQKFLEHATPNYGGWDDSKKDKMKFVKELANSAGSFYAFNQKGGSNVDFFIIAPNKNLVVLINHNM